MKNMPVPRNSLLVDFDYSLDLKPDRTLDFQDDAYEKGDDNVKNEKDEAGPNKQYARGQRTVSSVKNFSLQCNV